MSHHLHQTEGLILAARDQGESSVDLDFFTDELGLITARAQGLRLLKSKLRYHLGPFSLVNLNLVRGREIWRVIGAEKIGLPLFNSFARETLVQICLLLARLAPPEVEDPILYAELKKSLIAVPSQSSPTELVDLRLRLSAQILTRFGYGDEVIINQANSEQLAAIIDESLSFSQL